MGKPRRQTYTLEMYLKKLKDQDIRQDQDVQRLSDQWSNSMMNELIITVLNDGYIPPVILGQEENSQMWVVDGLQRSTALMRFRYGNYKITSAVEEPLITYQAKVRDSEGEIMLDGCGNIVWKNEQIDIRNKTFDKLPEELKKVFNEYQIETVIHENYNAEQISRLVRRYNFNKPMNVSQRTFTFVDRFARKIREILRKRFFVECTGYTKGERKNGTLERILMETVMCMFHLDNWKKTGQLGTYINENATDAEFETLEQLINRLENIVTEQHYSVFNSRDSFIWFSLFHKFTKLDCDNGKFADFLTYFKEQADNCDDINTLYGVEKGAATKDKTVIMKKLDTLENMMNEFLGIAKMELSTEPSSEILEFVREHVASYITKEDIEQYAEVLETLTKNIGHCSKLFENENMPSLIAVVAWSFENDVDLDEWILDYCDRTDSYISDQEENFRHMCEDLEQYINPKNVA